MLSLEVRKVNAALLFLQATACCFQAFYFDLGFALKPFIIITLLTLPLTLLLNGYSRKLLLYERLFFIFVVVAVLRGAVSISSLTYIRSAIALITVVLYYIAVSQTVSRLPPAWVTKIFLVSGSVFLVTSVVLYVFFPQLGAIVDRGTKRLSGTIIDPNIFVAFALPVLVVAASELFRSGILPFIALPLAGTAIFLTYSRGGMLGVAGACLLASLRNRKLWVTACLLLLVFTAQGGGLPGLELWQRPATDSSGRLEIWAQGYKLFRSRPMWGIGIDNFRSYSASLMHDVNYIHNTYLEVLVETGLIGFTLIAASLLALLLHRAVRREAQWIKICLCGQLIIVFFLSSLTLEAIYLIAALYTGLVNSEGVGT